MKPFTFLTAFTLLGCTLGSLSLKAQQALTVYKPDAAQMATVYHEADQLDTLLRKVELNNQVLPVWQADNQSFWYKRNLADKNWEYIYVNVKNGTRKKAFDAMRLATMLQKATGKAIVPGRLPLSKMFFNEQADQLTLKISDQWFKLDLLNYQYTATTDTLKDGYNALRP